ncbi:MAG TPA: GNAT family N-acetyltransferase [Alcanivoracaceae bacterium]|nr:GNAT family N-acetyltransferase [Alcanivoracaceae bacterium]
MTFSIKKTTWAEDEQHLKAVREAVFVKEQRVPEDIEWDGEDQNATHFLATNESNEPIGCIRLLPSGKISRLSVLETHRNNGIGNALLMAAAAEAKALGMKEIYLHAQTHATSFYEAAGFAVTGGIFIEADIPHRQMFKQL